MPTTEDDDRTRVHASGAAPAEPPAATPGERIGAYRVVREIGRGGMGSVWLAERADGLFERQVALKLPRLARGPQLAERIAREQRIVARLEHPHIARLYDAGIDQQGRPYMAVELVDGEMIHEHCQRLHLGLRERLRLIVQVIGAVAYAHGRLVVHRDLKPGNVLVDRQGRVRLLDFGIAALLDDPGEEGGDAERAMTPRYAAPEQLLGRAEGVATDVYSLGVLAFELLTGQLPHATAGLGLAALKQEVAHHDAALASTRAGDPATARALRGELDAILAKALRREPLLRYASADAFADDIERHLRDEPVRARPDTRSLHLRRWLRHHRALVAGTLAVMIALAAGGAVALHQAERARLEAARARTVKDFVVDVFRVNERGNPANAELRQLPAELLLERGAKLIDQRFAGQPDLEAELRGVVAGILLDLASPRLAAEQSERQLQALDRAGAPRAERALAELVLARALADDERVDAAWQAASSAAASARAAGSGWALPARASLLLADLSVRLNKRDEATTHLDAAEASLQSAGASRGSAEWLAVAAESARLRANLLNFLLVRFDEAKPLYEQAIELSLRAEGKLSARAIWTRSDLAFTLINLMRAHEAMPHLRAALQALRTLGGANDLVAAQVEANCVKWLVITRQMSYEEGRSIIETSRRSLAERGAQVPELALARLDFHLGQIAADWGDAEGAYRLLEPAVSRLKPTLQSPWPLFRLMTTLAAAAAETGRHGQAEALFDEAISIGRRAASADSPWLAETYVNAAMNLAMQGRIDAAESMLAALPEIAPVRGQTRAPLRYRDAVRLARARLALDRGDPQSAIALLPAPGEAGADEAALADADDVFFDRRLLRGAAWCASGRPREGLLLMAAGVDRAARYGSPHRAALASWRARTAACALAAGQPQQARELAALARAAFDAQPGVAAWFRAPLLAVQARLGRR